MEVPLRRDVNPLRVFNPLKPKNQVVILASMFATPAVARGGSILATRGGPILRKLALTTYKHGVPALVNYYALKPTLPALRGDRKLGIRFGADRVMPLGLVGGPIGMYVTPALQRLPIPIFGFGFTAVKNDEQFFELPISKSRGDKDATSTGISRSTRTASKTIDGPLANKNRQADRRPSSITPRAPLAGGWREDRRRHLQKGPSGGPTPVSTLLLETQETALLQIS